MKKKLESELMSIAHRILKLKGKEDIDRLHEEVAELYQKLTVLKFAYDNFSEPLPSLGDNTAFHSMVDRVFEKKVGDNIEIDDKIYVNMDEVEEDDIMEPAIETIKDIVAQIPPESRKVDELIKAITDVSNGGALEELLDHYSETPEFEPADSIEKEDSTEKKSLNDKLRPDSITIGLNDKIAFTKHLFNGSSDDFNRVLSQLNTSTSFVEAQKLVLERVKPDFNNWEGKEEYEERFLQIIESRFV